MELHNSERVEKHVLKKYSLIEKIGSGSYGHVWKVLCRRTKEILALKKIYDAFRNVKDSQRTYREISILKKLQSHPNLVRLKEVIRANNDKDIYLVFDYMECDLLSVIKESLLKETHIKFVTAQIAQALQFLHNSEIIHRDLKPANILIDSDCRVKLCDFGLSRFLSLKTGQELNMTEFVSTRWYRSPQIIFGSHQYSKQTDIWSFGCMLGEMLSEKPLFAGKTIIDQIERMMSFVGYPSAEDLASLKSEHANELFQSVKIKKMPPSYWFKDVSSEAIDLVYKLLRFNPKHRLTLKQVLEHPFVRGYVDMIDASQSPGQVIVCDINDNVQLPVQQYRSLIYQMLTTQRGNRCPLIKSPTERPHRYSVSICQSQDKFKEKSKDKQNVKPMLKQGKSVWVSSHITKQAGNIYSNKVSAQNTPITYSPNASMLMKNKPEDDLAPSRKFVSIYRKVVRKRS